MKLLRLVPVLLVLVAVLVAAGCGGGGSTSVPQDAVATVGSDTITKAQFNFLLAGAKAQAKAAKQTFPTPGTPDYKTLQDKALAYLVQESELEQKGKDIGVQVTDADVTKQIKQIKQQYFGGNDKEFQKQLKLQGFTLPLLELYQRGNLLSDKLYKKITGPVKVTDADVQKYYNKNKSQYTTAASRKVRHILVNNKKLADQIEQQLKGGASFATLAKKYSKDTLSAVKGGDLGTIQQGKTVPSFDKAAFSLKTNQISAPVHSTYGWHIIQPLSAVKPAATQPLSAVSTAIHSNLLQQKKTSAFQKWLDGVKTDFDKSVHYQTGYVPASTSTTATDTQASTTG
jgi:parvulin-like peptidyl-prolyl isomerase